MFRNRINPTPALYSGHYYKEVLVPWMWNRITPAHFEFSVDTKEFSINQKELPQIYLFRIPDPEQKMPYEENFEKVANKNHEEFVFSKFTLDSEIEREVAKLIGVKQQDLPTIRIVDGERMMKFKYPGDVSKMSEKQLLKFLIAFDDDKLTQYFRSAAIPEKQTGAVTVIVGDSRKEIINDAEKDVFVIYTIDWSQESKKISSIWEDVAKELRDVPNLVLGSYDITFNDPVEESIKQFPDFYLFPKATKNEPIRYEGSITTVGFKNFLK